MNLMNKLVSKNLLLNKKRSIVTVIGIILSASLLVALATLITSFQKSLVVFEKEKGGDYHFYFSNTTDADRNMILSNRKIESEYTVQDLGYALFPQSKNSTKPYLRVVSMEKESFSPAGVRLIEGRLPENSSEVVIPAHIKTNARVELHVGDTLTLDMGTRFSDSDGEEWYPNSQTGYWGANEERLINATEHSYTIVGIIERVPYSIEPYSCPGYTVVTCAEQPISGTAEFYVRLTKEGLKDANGVIAGIYGADPEMVDRVFNGEGSDEDYLTLGEIESKYSFSLSFNNWLIQYERVWPLDPSVQVLFILGTIVALIIIVTSVYCIKNSFEISISEKIRQYGMLASVGATSRQIRKSVHTEAAILGAIGLPFGLIFGNLAAFILVKVCNVMLVDSLNIGLIFGPALWGNALAVVLGCLTIYLSAQRSARMASKITPLEAIRNQKEIKINTKKLKTPKLIEKIWGIGGVISYKNIKRNRRKYRTTTVSIVICTITFIVISYFTSLVFSLVGMVYSTEKANIYTYLHQTNSYEKVIEVAESMDNVEEYSVIISRSIKNESLEWTGEYKEYAENIGLHREDDGFQILCMNDASFEKYAEAIGVSKNSEGLILVNTIKYKIYAEDGEKSGQLNRYEVNKGTELSFSLNDIPMTDEPAKPDVYSIPIIGTTNDRPLGYMGSISSAYGVIRISTAEKLGILPCEQPTIDLAFVSTDPDKLQEDLEKTLDAAVPEAEFTVNNAEKNRRSEKSLFTMLAIFAYGLIAVIALIGITNIVNTLGTSMELRAREFATLRSVGMTDAEFNRMARLESLFIAGKSLLIGNILGILITYLINIAESRWDTVIIYKLPAGACIISIVVVMLLIYTIISVSMNRIIKRNVIETIKNENL